MFLGQQCHVGVFASLRPAEKQLDESKERHPILWARCSQGPCPPQPLCQWSSLSWPQLQHSSFFLGKMGHLFRWGLCSAPPTPFCRGYLCAFAALSLWLLSYYGSNELTARNPAAQRPQQVPLSTTHPPRPTDVLPSFSYSMHLLKRTATP